MATVTLDAFQVIADSLTINSLADHFDMSRPAVSKHVKILHLGGLFLSVTLAAKGIVC